MKIVIVDPIFKASRLYYSTLAAKASNQMGYKPVVLTRNYSNTEHYVEMMEKVDHDLIEICDLPEDFWYGKIDASQLTLVFRQIEIMAADDELIVYFSGLNEIWPEIVDVVKKQFASLSNVHMIFVEYHPEYLLNIGARIRASGLLHYLKQYVRIFKHKQIQLQRFRELDKASFSYDIIVLDERIHEKRMGAIPRFLKSKVHVNCDPAQSPLLSTVTTVVKDSITLLSVGLQSRRKGLVQIIRLAELAKIQSLPIRIRIVGRLEKDTEFLRSRIASASNIEFI
jgi:glycosyltransferase involved in cell wall biosynthesis